MPPNPGVGRSPAAEPAPQRDTPGLGLSAVQGLHRALRALRPGTSRLKAVCAANPGRGGCLRARYRGDDGAIPNPQGRGTTDSNVFSDIADGAAAGRRTAKGKDIRISCS